MYTSGFLLLATLSFAFATNVNRQQCRILESYIDTSVDPCKDYFEYACGYWEAVHDGADYYDSLGKIDYQVNLKLAKVLKILKRNKTEQRKSKLIRKLLNYYRSCTTLDAYEPINYLKWLKKHENFTWTTLLPTLQRSRHRKSDNLDWLRMLAMLRKYGLNGVWLEETVLQHREDTRVSRIDLDKPVLNGGFEPLTYKGFSIVMEYFDITEQESIEELWDSLHLFEGKLKSLDDIEDDMGSQLLTLAQLDQRWIDEYLGIVLEEPMSRSTEIYIQNLPYIQALFELLNEYENEFLQRYLLIRFVWYLNVEGPTNFVNSDCVEHMRGMMPLAMDWLYEQHSQDLLKQTSDIKALFRELLQHFKNKLSDNANNFNATVLQKLLFKVEHMKIKVGNLPRSSTTEMVEEFYEGLDFNPADFYANHLKILRFTVKAQHARLHTLLPLDDDFFHLADSDTGASSSPYYLLRYNVVIVPLTLLQTPIYHAHLHDVFKFSTLGFLLAHEITHGFDESGLEFDYQGNAFVPAELVREHTLFVENLDCLRKKHAQIIDEKVADVSGLRLAFEAYFKNSSTATAESPPLRWSAFTAEQLFFLNFAQFFCSTNSEEKLDFSEHGSDRQRVLDTLANFASFGRVYNCPLGSHMNPEKKCQLWR